MAGFSEIAMNLRVKRNDQDLLHKPPFPLKILRHIIITRWQDFLDCDIDTKVGACAMEVNGRKDARRVCGPL